MTGWESKSLGEVCEILDSRRRPVTKKDRRAGEYPYYGATGIVDYVDDFIFDEPLVLVGEDGAKWGSGEGTAFAVSGRCWVNNHAHVLRPLRGTLLDDWLIYYMVHKDLSPFVSGLTVPKLNQANLREIPVPLPPLDEQRRIVAILDEAFESIAIALANTVKNLQNVHELFESRRWQIFTSSSGWSHTLLGSACSIARGGSPRPIKAFLTSEPDGVNWVKISDATASEKYIYETAGKIKPSGVSRSRLVHDGDFLLSNSMSFGRPYIMRTTGCIHDGWLVLSNYGGAFDQDFLYLLLGSRFVYQQFDRLAAGSTVRNLNIDLASIVRVPVPGIDEQIAIAAELGELSDSVDQMARLYRQKEAALDEYKKSLLQQAFTGALTAASATRVNAEAA